MRILKSQIQWKVKGTYKWQVQIVKCFRSIQLCLRIVGTTTLCLSRNIDPFSSGQNVDIPFIILENIWSSTTCAKSYFNHFHRNNKFIRRDMILVKIINLCYIYGTQCCDECQLEYLILWSIVNTVTILNIVINEAILWLKHFYNIYNNSNCNFLH